MLVVRGRMGQGERRPEKHIGQGRAGSRPSKPYGPGAGRSAGKRASKARGVKGASVCWIGVKRDRGEKKELNATARLSRHLIWQKRNRGWIGRLAHGRGRKGGGLGLPADCADDNRQA